MHKRIIARVCASLMTAILLTIVGYLISLLMHTKVDGIFHSYDIFKHDPCDVLNFSGGTVTLQTCCGDELWGTYEKSDDGRMRWTFRRGATVTSFDQVFVVQVNALSITCTPVDPLRKAFDLRRRLFRNFPL